MSGHSKWAKIKRAKGVTDQKRGALFTKLARAITQAAQDGGGDAGMNFSLRLAVDKAKSANMPLDNIERAIKKGTGELQPDAVFRMTYEAIMQSGAMVLIDCVTDNSNRTYSEIRNIIERAGEKLGAAGSVSWQFAEEGQIEAVAAKLQKSTKYGEKDNYSPANGSQLEDSLLEIEGIIDYLREEYDPAEPFVDDLGNPINADFFTIRAEKSKLKEIADKLNKAEWQLISTAVVKNTSNKVNITPAQEDKLQGVLEQLEERDDVDNVWTNVA